MQVRNMGFNLLYKGNTKILFFTFLFLLVSVYPLAAQDPWEEDGEIEDAEIIIEKDQKIELPPASRNFEKVPPPPVAPAESEQQFQFKNFNYQLSDIEPQIRVLTIKDDELAKLYGNFVKVGFGNYITPYFEGFFNNKRNDRYSYGAHIKHLSSRNGPVDKINSGTSENHINLMGKYFTPSIGFDGALSYERDMYHFYGYNDELLTPDSEEIRQIYHTMGARLTMENINPDAFDYKLNATYSNINDYYNASEGIAGLNLDSRFSVAGAFGIRLRSDLYLMNRKEGTSLSRNLFRLKPNFEIQIDQFDVEFGLNFVYENDTIANFDKLHMYPFAKASFDLTEDINVYAAVDGDIQRNTLHSFAEENPFIVSRIDIFNTNKTLELSGGIKGKLLQNISFHAGLSAANYKNMYFFVNSLADSTRFDVVYDQNDTELFNFFVETGYTKEDIFRLVARADFYGYSTTSVEEAWHKPTFKLGILGTYTLYDKIRFNADMNILGGIKAREIGTGEAIALDQIVDLSLKADYLFSNRFSAFLSVNNILNNNYERYLNYPSRGLMGMVGATYAF